MKYLKTIWLGKTNRTGYVLSVLCVVLGLFLHQFYLNPFDICYVCRPPELFPWEEIVELFGATTLGKSKELNSNSIHAFIRHIPIRGYDESTDNALRISDDCLKQLYEYSKEMNFIPKDYSYDDFITYYQLSPDDIVFLKNGGKTEKGECVYVWDHGIRIKGAGQEL